MASRADRRVPLQQIALMAAACFTTAALAQPEPPVHVVQPGDTLYGIAASYDTSVTALRQLNGLEGDLLRVGADIVLPTGSIDPVGYRPYLAGVDATWASVSQAVERSVEALRSANPEIPPGAEPAGRLLLVPPGEGVTRRAAAGETMSSVAHASGIAPDALAALNGLAPGDVLLVGQPVLLPSGDSAVRGAPAPIADMRGGPEGWALNTAPHVANTALVTNAADAATAGPAADPRAQHRAAQLALLREAPDLLPDLAWPDTGFALPVGGRLSSAFGWRNISVGGNTFHGGIDIAADAGTPVAVARAGVVVRAGWIGAYGYAVYVDHGDGTETRYAHLQAVHVRTGEVVRRGDAVGDVGSTGASTGPHLHFEIRIDGRAVDPLGYIALR